MTKTPLGIRVRDSITGFAGVSVARCEYLHKPPQVEIQPDSVDSDGKMLDSCWFDEPRVEIINGDSPKVGFHHE